MAGFSKLYVIGELGGFAGSDGVNPIYLQIWVGDSDRQWLEAHYVDPTIKPIAAISTLVPEGPNHPNALLDACIAFFPKHFEKCPSLEKAAELLKGETQLDVDVGRVPPVWIALRKEAKPYFEQLNIFEAVLRPLKPLPRI